MRMRILPSRYYGAGLLDAAAATAPYTPAVTPSG